ncbi:acyl-CoA dehydrogenase family protein [Paraburkholderia sp. MM6662-R1]|uniref:acyl-CoA dehydrogenase family protein n=1 Tax=Paraburkholderia sp. MM6662-R1 TaxID=2991066 RepID=UPI003D21FC91
MDVLLNEQETLVQETARTFLEAECTPALVRESEKNEEGFSRGLWKQLAALGWLGLSLPEEHGGQGLPVTYLALLLEEMGRHIAPLPVHSTLVPATVIAKHGTESQKALLSEVVEGDAVLSFALQESGGRWSENAIELTGDLDGDGIVLSGKKLFVADFQHASHCLVAFRWAGQVGPDALALALVDSAADGVAVHQLQPLAKDQECAVAFNRVRVSQDSIIRSAAAVKDLMDYAAVLMACQMQGAARKALELAAAYVSQREAFGQSIGSFQAIQHLAADMLNAVDGAQLLSREAVWRISQNLPARVEVAQAKSFANEKCLFVCRSAQQMHGGIGFIEEFDINLWYRKVASWGLRAGTTYEHRRLIAQALLDTPDRVRLGMTQYLPASRSSSGLNGEAKKPDSMHQKMGGRLHAEP